MRLYITKCNRQINPKCKSDQEIELFLDNVVFRMILYEEKSKFSFKNTTEYFTTVRKEENQINVKFDQYTYFDYSLSFSRIVDRTNRINPFEKERIHNFLSSLKFGEIVYPKFDTFYLATRDNGKTIRVEEVQLLYAFRFLPDSKMTIE